MRAVDVLALYATAQTASWLCFSALLDAAPPIHTTLLFFCCALAFVLLAQFDLYHSWRGRSLRILFTRTALAIAIVLSAGVVFSFLIQQVDQLSRLWLAVWFVLSLTALMSLRILLYSGLSVLRERGYNHKRVIIVGYGETGRELHRRAQQQLWTGYQIKAIHASREAPIFTSNIEKLDHLYQIPAAITRHAVHEIWLALPLSESAKLQDVQYLLRNMLLDIRWFPDTSAMGILSNKTVEFLGLPVVELNRPPSEGIVGVSKEIFDRLFALIVLLLLLPLMLSLALLIKLSSPGPVLFRQPRLGLNGRRFDVYKFRSMKLHSEDANQVTQATRNDPRITTIGQFIRRTSLDELPQFINVLKGEMSVVGPRPHALQHNDLYKDKLTLYMLRHRVKPGITGWAQIHGCRGETDSDEKMERRVAFDLHYIRHWSFWMDLKIISWTAFKGWTDNNVY